MSWQNIIKFDRNPYFDGESYMEQVEDIAKDIKKVMNAFNDAKLIEIKNNED